MFNGLEGSKQIDEMQVGKTCRGSNYLPIGMQENVFKEIQQAIDVSFSKVTTSDKVSYAPQVGINSNNSHICKPGKKCDDKKLDKLLEDEADNNIIEAQIIIKLNGPKGSIHFYEPQIWKIGRGLDDPQVGMPKNLCNILQESLKLNGSKDGKIEKLSYASQIGRNYNNTRVCKYG